MNLPTTVALATATATALLLTAAPYARPPHRAPVDPAPCVSGESETRADSAVDEGEIRWTEATKYDDARTHATKKWHTRTGTLSKIKIRADTATTVNDLQWRDYDRADGKGGYFERHGGVAQTDYIYLNKHYLDGRNGSRNYRRAVAAHELGHALGLCHKSDRILSLMWRTADADVNEPMDVDKANYKKLWG